MATNPDNKCYGGPDKYLCPATGMLRFVYIDEGKIGPSRILQRYEWSQTLNKHDWFDVGMFDE